MKALMDVLLIDLPTFPKGMVSISLPVVAALLGERFKIRIIDLNIEDFSSDDIDRTMSADIGFFGMKVSSQNYEYAVGLSRKLKGRFPAIPIVWGGEFPSLMPEESLKFADSIIMGGFEGSVDEFVHGILSGSLKERYDYRSYSVGKKKVPPLPRLDLFPDLDRYYSFMGIPLETSKGCDRKCTFCMVHVMQKEHTLQEETYLRSFLSREFFRGRFVNVIDYNLGVDREHLLRTAGILGESPVLGWSAEMCIERLDDDELLRTLSKSRCRIIYCGLESIDEASLRSVNKSRTNLVHEYERIIRKVQSYGINVGVGVILGLSGTTEETFIRLSEFFNRLNIVYIKLTFLTFNPGTKVMQSMLRKGGYVTEDLKKYDGNHLTFKAKDIDPEVIFNGARLLIRNTYSPWAIFRRISPLRMGFLLKLEYMTYAYCFGEAYRDWLKHEILTLEESSFDDLLVRKFRKRMPIKLMELVLKLARYGQYLSKGKEGSFIDLFVSSWNGVKN